MALITLLLFSTIALVAIFKDDSAISEPPAIVMPIANAPVEIQLDRSAQAVVPAVPRKPVAVGQKANPAPAITAPVASVLPIPEVPIPPNTPAVPLPSPAPKPQAEAAAQKPQTIAATSTENLPEADRIAEFFKKDSKFPFVETVVYKSRVAWLKGRPAWLSDYASHYQTSRHFIARSLHGKPDYFKQDLAENDRFNVLRKDKKIEFHLLIDLSRCKMWFYAIDTGANERTLIKTYRVGLGRVDSAKPSGLLTPMGKYSLGNKIAIYKPKMMGYHNSERVEMVGVFGSRWIPFDKEIGKCTAPAKGFGVHGVPWVASSSGERTQDTNSLGKYQSDGCVRLATEDVEEIFAIVITKPTTIELVKDFHDAQLPGVEKQ